MHEYIENPLELSEAVELAKEFVTELINTQKSIKTYSYERLNVEQIDKD